MKRDVSATMAAVVRQMHDMHGAVELLETVMHDFDTTAYIRFTRHQLKRRFPILHEVIDGMENWLDEIDNRVMSDETIVDDATFDLAAVGALLDLVLKAIPDEVFERGKWATVQAWQQRTGSESSPGFNSS